MSITLRRINDYTCEVRSEYIGEVEISYVRAPEAGGYVRWDGEQVCVGMNDRGATLSWRPGAEDVTELVRRHFRAAGKL